MSNENKVPAFKATATKRPRTREEKVAELTDLSSPTCITNLATNFENNVVRLFNKDMRLLTGKEHATWGIVSERGELIDAFKRHYVYGADLDVGNVIEEAGDIVFYVVALLHECNSSDAHTMLVRCMIHKYSKVDLRESPISLVNCLININIKCTAMAHLLSKLCHLLYVHDLDLARVLAENIVKLQQRYPDGYTDESAQARADKFSAQLNSKMSQPAPVSLMSRNKNSTI